MSPNPQGSEGHQAKTAAVRSTKVAGSQHGSTTRQTHKTHSRIMVQFPYPIHISIRHDAERYHTLPTQSTHLPGIGG
jgi:hypothetical protein